MREARKINPSDNVVVNDHVQFIDGKWSGRLTIVIDVPVPKAESWEEIDMKFKSVLEDELQSKVEKLKKDLDWRNELRAKGEYK